MNRCRFVIGVALALFFLAGQLVSSRADETVSKAGKIFHKAVRLAGHGQVEAAFPLFEQAIRLEPDNGMFRVRAAFYFEKFTNNQEAIESETAARLRIQMLNRALDLTDKLPIESYEQIFERGFWGADSFWIARRTLDDPDQTPPYPAWKTDLTKLRQRCQKKWLEAHRWVLNAVRNPTGSEEEQKKIFENYVWFITISDYIYNVLLIDLGAPAYDAAVSGLLDVFTDDIAGLLDNAEDIKSIEATTETRIPRRYPLDEKTQQSIDGRFFSNMLGDFSDFSRRTDDGSELRSTREKLERIAEKLQTSKLPFFSIRGSLLKYLLENPEIQYDRFHRNTRLQLFENNADRQKHVDFFDALRADLPETTTAADRNMLDKIAQGGTGIIRSTISTNSKDQATALQSGDYSSVTSSSLLYPETREGALASIKRIECMLEHIESESKPGGLFAEKPSVARSGVGQTLGWLKRKAGLAIYETPWQEKVELLPVLSNGWYVEPTIRKNKLHVFEIDGKNKAVRLQTINLDDRSVKTGEAIDLDVGSTENISPNEIGRWESPTRLDRFYSGFADDGNAYLGTAGFGIFVFPLDGSEPWRITMADGLPSNAVQGIGMIRESLYAGIGRSTGATWLVRINLESEPSDSRIEILSSSMDEEGQTPFVNMTGPAKFTPFRLDEKRDRLLFRAETPRDWKPKLSGIWSIDGETGQFAQLPDLFGNAEKMELLPDGDTLLLGDNWTTGIVDLRTGQYTLIAASLHGNETEIYAVRNKLMKPLLGRSHRFDLMTVADGWVWGMRRESPVQCFWSRAKLDDPSQWALLELPDGMDPENQGWFPDYDILAHPSGKGVIACNTQHIVLFQ